MKVNNNTYRSSSTDANNHVYSKLYDYKLLVKLNLSATVVFTSLLGYLIMSGMNFKMIDLVLLTLGGFLVTAAANAINEVLEKDYDALMSRTKDRPLADGRMTVSEAVLFAGLSCVVGVTLLGFFNPITGILGMVSFLIYSFIYTPMKRISSVSIAIGAIPGALPLLIGCTAYEGRISALAICLFAVQFLWQFPHFLSIGFLGFDDYKRAGFNLVPQKDSKVDENIGLHALLYSCMIIPITIFLYLNDYSTTTAFFVTLSLSIAFTWYALKFNQGRDKASARKLMFASFGFMPFYLLTLLFF